jgi:hypothetical protein
VTKLELARSLDVLSAIKVRENFDYDMNGDGVITISDIWSWIGWVYFAPGDLMLLGAMRDLTNFARFFEMTPQMLSGVWSFFISTLFWLWILRIIKAFISALVKPVTRNTKT